MKPGNRLTEHDHARIHELAEQGLGSGRIARTIGKHPSTVSWFMYSAGLRAPRPSPASPASYVRNGRRVHRFTAAEDELIEQLRARGEGFAAIAAAADAQFGTARSAHVIQCRLIMLAARGDE